ncbi:hypothetical protein H6P81_003605 [Aristolochia fimbriata]|uniref:Uncharacterized protein n=1 Tax=Aristolochia fimbriata TaxID=158543 RepID=A0AAV7FD33_ARIFI|nr:hypothetical protein H6P81_003605 [Aristolochia fimbriata]
MASSAGVTDEEVGNIRGGESVVVYKPRGCSTAQMRLLRIMEVIASGSKEATPAAGASNRECRNGESGAGGSRAAARDFLAGFGIDLNLRLGPSGEVLAWEEHDHPAAAAAAAAAATTTVVEGEELSSVCSGVGGNEAKASGGLGLCSSVESGDASTVEKSCNGECEREERVGKLSEVAEAEDEDRVAGEENEAGARELSGITNVEGKGRRNEETRRDREEEAVSGEERDSREDDEVVVEAGEKKGGNEKRKEEYSGGGGGEGGYLHLLLDAVRHISEALAAAAAAAAFLLLLLPDSIYVHT